MGVQRFIGDMSFFHTSAWRNRVTRWNLGCKDWVTAKDVNQAWFLRNIVHTGFLTGDDKRFSIIKGKFFKEHFPGDIPLWEGKNYAKSFKKYFLMLERLQVSMISWNHLVNKRLNQRENYAPHFGIWPSLARLFFFCSFYLDSQIRVKSLV